MVFISIITIRFNATDMNLYGQQFSILIISFTAVIINWIVYTI